MIHIVFGTSSGKVSLCQVSSLHVQNKSIIYRSWHIYFTDQNFNISRSGNIARKSNLRYLKTLKTKKVNTKNPQTKHCQCSEYVMIYRPDVQFTDQKKRAKKVTKN